MGTSALAVNWEAAAASLAEPGWVRLAAALRPEGVGTLRNARRPHWHDLPEDEGVVLQHGLGTYLPMGDCDGGVKLIAAELVSALSPAAQARGLPPVPDFNEATWTHYPRGTGHITAHRDPDAYGGVIAVFTLYGAATFRIVGQKHPAEWQTESGDVVMLRGRGWPTPDATCPAHAVDAPRDNDRMIMTMRFNSRGPGAGYDV